MQEKLEKNIKLTCALFLDMKHKIRLMTTVPPSFISRTVVLESLCHNSLIPKEPPLWAKRAQRTVPQGSAKT